MRNEFAQAMIDSYDEHGNLLFITGDLGYMALEKVEQKFGERFINAGVAEQNMVTVAAAMAHEGFVPFIYSIAPFITIRPYEQIRNDVCLHNLPVKLVGNGGGYGYGIMGATHHNIEDIGAMRMLPHMRVYVPFITTDVAQAVRQMLHDKNPNYLRLNVGAKVNHPVAPFAQWRKIKDGRKGVVVGTGPVLENICNLPIADDLEIWVLSVFPIGELPEELLDSIRVTQKLITIEEHTAQGGLCETLSFHLINQLQQPITMLPLYAQGYPGGKYGDQKWHQEQNSLGGISMSEKVATFLA